MNISVTKVLSLKRHLSGQKTFPAMLKGRSTEADDAGIHKYLGTSFAMHENHFL